MATTYKATSRILAGNVDDNGKVKQTVFEIGDEVTKAKAEAAGANWDQLVNEGSLTTGELEDAPTPTETAEKSVSEIAGAPKATAGQ